MASVMDSVDQRTQLAGNNRLELLLFRLNGKQVYGINVFKIQEVVGCPKLTQIPHSSSVVRGIATMRGKTIPVMDLSMSMGESQLDDIETRFVIVTEYNRSTQGFLIGGVEHIVNLNWEDVLPPPKGSGKDSYLTAITQLDDYLVEIIDVEKVLAEVNNASNEVSQAVIDAATGAIHGQHVLVVDDSSVARNQIQRTLEQLNIKCTLANNGREAIEMLRTWSETSDKRLANLAMVLSDVEMPEMDGYTLTTEIRNDPALSGLYVLLHSSLSGHFNFAMIDKVGADKFVPKFKPDELAEVVLDRMRSYHLPV